MHSIVHELSLASLKVKDKKYVTIGCNGIQKSIISVIRTVNIRRYHGDTTVN